MPPLGTGLVPLPDLDDLPAVTSLRAYNFPGNMVYRGWHCSMVGGVSASRIKTKTKTPYRMYVT